jgi:hypothetical protein
MAEEEYVSDRQFLDHILPGHYIVSESVAGAIWCRSSVGIDADRWDMTFKAIENHFGERFREVFHRTCYLHKHFCVYYKTSNSITHTPQQ